MFIIINIICFVDLIAAVATGNETIERNIFIIISVCFHYTLIINYNIIYFLLINLISRLLGVEKGLIISSISSYSTNLHLVLTRHECKIRVSVIEHLLYHLCFYLFY